MEIVFEFSQVVLYRLPRSCFLGKDKMLARFENFSAGQWADLFRASGKCLEQVVVVFPTTGKKEGFNKRVSTVLHLVQLGELFRQAGVGGCSFKPWHSGHFQSVEGSSEVPTKTT